MPKSFGLLRTNVGLTTNVKIMVDSQYNLALDSIESLPELTISKYKKLSFNKTNYYDQLVPFLWDQLSSDTAFSIKYDDDNDSMSDKFSNQYDELYQYGARNIINNKNYNEEYEYFAPLYINRGKLPNNFVIFRVDGPGLLSLDKFNFRKEIINNFKIVKLFDMTLNTDFGQWLDLNFNKNNFFPDTPFEMNFTRLEFSKWNGIDYKTGGYVSKSLFLDDYLEKENEIFEFEKFVFDTYKSNGVIFPNILNLSFLFDDNPATGDSLRKWSINRYYGFYLDNIDLVKTLSPYNPPKLKPGVKITNGNVLKTLDNTSPFIDPWDDNNDYYVEYLGIYYKIEKFTYQSQPSVQSIKKSNNLFSEEVVTTNIDSWRIISDIDLFDKQDLLNINIGIIDSNKRLVYQNGESFNIDNFELSDVWIIEIDGLYHNLIKNDGYLTIISDYSFEFSDNSFKYWINKNDTSLTTNVDFTLTKGEKPITFKIYRLDFSDIKDFDTRIVDTEYSKYEYEKLSDITNTDETKMYLLNLNDTTYPQSFDNFIYKNETEHIPVASEYTANHEIFKIENDDLTSLWRKNPIYCRWSYKQSLSGNDYPYVLNNSKVFEMFNRTTNTYDGETKRGERTLDYFYTINSSTHSYLHHTLHIENNNINGIDNNFFFDFDKYLGIATYITGTNSTNLYNIDYFSWFFDRKTTFLSNQITKNVTKYSYFNKGDKNTPNITLFRGIKFSIYDVENIRKNSSGILEVINTKNLNNYEDYKFSILLTSKDNGMEWQVIQNWEMEKFYSTGSIVLHDDILYQAISDNTINEPSYKYNYTNSNQSYSVDIKSSPYSTLSNITDLTTDHKLNTYWTFYDDINSPFWNPNRASLPPSSSLEYTTGSIVYNSEEWYVYNTSGNIDFWNPYLSLQYGSPYFLYPTTNNISSGYQTGSLVIYKGNVYKSLIDNNYQKPDYTQQFRTYGSYTQYIVSDDNLVPTTTIGDIWSNNWEIVDLDPTNLKWNKIEVWNPGSTYQFNNYIVHNKIVYVATYSTPVNNFVPIGDEPGVSPYWNRIYGLEPDTDFVYNTKSNPYILMNNELYKITNNPNNNTLENGITIYINKKWKNILINIFINDNTLSNLSNSDRDDLYISLNKKLTAKNFIDSINDITNKYEFSDYIKYVVIDENQNVSEYNYDNVEQLPIIIFADGPEQVNFKVNSLIKKPITIDKLKPTKVLNNSFINNLSELNYYNNTSIANSITENLDTPLVLPKYHGISNIVNDTIFRFSGDYMPLFYSIDIFQKDNNINYNEIQLVFYTDSDDNFNFTLTNVNTITESIYIYQDNYYGQIMNYLQTHSLFSGANFIFEILKSGSKYINSDLNVGYDVLSIKYLSSYGNIQITVTQ